MMLSRTVICSTFLASFLVLSTGCGKSQKKPTVLLNEPRVNLAGSNGDSADGVSGTSRGAGAGVGFNPSGNVPGSDPGMNGSGSSFAGTLGGGSGMGSMGGSAVVDPSTNSFAQNGNSSNVDSATEIADLDMVHFDYDSAELKEDWKAILTKHAAWLNEHPTVNVQVEGHCDERGTDEYNIALGQRRADIIREFLISQGVEATRIVTISYGKMRPISYDETEESNYLNRRGMFLVYTPDFSTETASAF
ncbi:MAG: peptidoglycan-associated lipoprotein Pal [Sumerlaeia bacterium]